MSTPIASQTDTQRQFSTLLDQHRGIVLRIVGTYCWHADDRDDLRQEIVSQLWRGFPRYDASRPFSTWMYRVALNVAISYVRSHRQRQQQTVALGDEVDQLVDPASTADDERVDFLRRFIAELDPLNRALMLLYLEAHSYREIADIVGISQTNVATKISRLKRRLRECSADIDEQGATHGTG